MAKKKPVPTQQTTRHIRRQQQREATAALVPIPNSAPIAASEDSLGPSLLVPVYCSIIVIGYLLYARGLATLKGNELSHHQALFTAVNAATLTGFLQARNPENYTFAGKVLTLLLTLSGMLFSFICGGAAVVRIARLQFKNWHIVTWAFASIALVAIGGGLAIKVGGGADAGQRSFPEAVFLAISAFGNSGLTLGNLPSATTATGMMVLLPLAVLGGLGLPVLMDLADRIRGKAKLSQHSCTVLNWTAGSYLVITLLLFLLRCPGTNASLSVWISSFADASQESINARSAGFPFLSISALPQSITFVLILVMIIGASPGGSTGGLKVTTLAELTRGTRATLAGRPAGRPFGVAIVWLLVYLGMLITSTVALLIAEPEIQLNRSLFLASSALGNVGLSHDRVDASTAGLYVLSVTMMLGRIAPAMMLWYVVDTTPEAAVAVG